MPISEKLNDMKRVSQLTVQQISDRSGVPIGTVSRILTGHTDNPTFVTVRDIVKAMGGSLDDLAGIARPDSSAALEASQAEVEQARAEAAAARSEAAAANESRELFRKMLETRGHWLIYLAVFAGLVTFLLLLILFIDYTDPAKGFFWVN